MIEVLGEGGHNLIWHNNNAMEVNVSHSRQKRFDNREV